ncbi:DUF4279 domain-containing protein [Luteibacter flocculans]|uniref:DUF4279 domain-containing protein n=1 Tax=Luteibacter flocculans TaxID=2780091 RepID=A0ABY4T6K8_9GAMM|nr:DUF4279 domain-containing protein [Luteibacter flocculans]URL59854.1 DUF4279 domain-containing protein [Luteibacter flocculans]
MTISVSLRIFSQDLTAADIVASLSLTPARQWTKGEIRTAPSGRVLDGVWENTYVTFRLMDRQRIGLADALSSCVRQLNHLASALGKLRQSGAKTELFVGWFLDKDSGDALPSNLLAALSNLGLDLSLDVYTADTPSKAHP